MLWVKIMIDLLKNQLEYKHNADGLITPPKLTVYQNMKLTVQKNKQHFTSSNDVIDYIYNV